MKMFQQAVDYLFELGYTAPQHGIGFMAPFKKKLVGSTSRLHRDKILGMNPTT